MTRIETRRDGTVSLFVTCLDCGNEQEYMGTGVECEECGGDLDEPTVDELAMLDAAGGEK